MLKKFNKISLKLFIVIILFVGIGIGYFFPNKQTPIKPTQVQQPSTPKNIYSGNNFDEATPLKPGYETPGKFSNENEVDVYSFQVDTPANIKTELKNVPFQYTLEIYNFNRKLVASANRVGFKESSSVFELPNAGSYYIKISASYKQLTNSPYSITLTVQPFLHD